VLLANAWNVLYRAQRSHRLATTGPRLRHPQYAGAQAMTYGNWLNMSGRGPYLIRVEAHVPGEMDSLKVELRYRPVGS
jgi:hypothetical protein